MALAFRNRPRFCQVVCLWGGRNRWRFRPDPDSRRGYGDLQIGFRGMEDRGAELTQQISKLLARFVLIQVPVERLRSPEVFELVRHAALHDYGTNIDSFETFSVGGTRKASGDRILV